MKVSTQLLILFSALAVASFAPVIARAADQPDAQPPVPGRGSHGPPPEVMAIYDVDQNGALDEDERAILREDIASGKFVPPGAWGRRRGLGGPGHGGLPPGFKAKYDANQDGRLDETERAALRADVEAGKVTLPPRGPAGRLHGRMMRQPPPEIMVQYDTNKDGKLDETEHAALRADIQSGKIAPPHRPGGRGPGPHRGPGEDPPASAEIDSGNL